MKTTVSVFFSFVKYWLIYLTTKKPVSKEQYASINLFKTTFRIPETDRHSKTLLLKKLLDLIVTIFSKSRNENAFLIDKENGVFIYDISRNGYEARRNYVNYFTKQGSISGGIFKEELYHRSSPLSSIVLLLLVFAWFPFLFISSLLKKDKAPFAIIFREMVELINLLQLCQKLNVKVVFFFSIYEKDANVCTLLLNKKGIEVNKITSESPLNFWNKIIIANCLCLCSGYQYDELKENARSVFVSDIHLWGPEQVLENISKYHNPIETSKKTIGFYSTGAWVRKLENHMNQNVDLEKMEEEVKQVLKRFCLSNPDYQLIVFLHPREKWEKYSKQTFEKYQQDFDGIHFHLEKSNSSHTFEKADLGIAFLSTIVFERLYYGFKTLLMPIGVENSFPVSGSNISSICAYSQQELFNKIKENVHFSNLDFFEKNSVRSYAKFLYN